MKHLLSAFCFLLCMAGQAQTLPDVVAIALAARQASVPVSIVLRAENDLCRVTSATADLPADPMMRLRVLANRNGYRVEEGGPVLVIRASGGVPNELQAALSHRWEHFPKMDSMMREMGMVLNGWLFSIAEPKRGFAMSIASNGLEEIIHLPASEGLSSEEIANRIVALGSKGVWIAWQRPRTADGRAGEVALGTLSYRDDLLAIRSFRCG